MNMATAVYFVLEDDRFNDQMKNEFKNVIGREPNSKLPNMYSSNMEHLGKGLNLASCVSRTAQANINNDKKIINLEEKEERNIMTIMNNL